MRLAVGTPRYFYHIDRVNLPCLVAHTFEVLHYVDFVWDGDVEPLQVGVLFENARQFVNVRNLERQILRINTLIGKFLVEKCR